MHRQRMQRNEEAGAGLSPADDASARDRSPKAIRPVMTSILSAAGLELAIAIVQKNSCVRSCLEVLDTRPIMIEFVACCSLFDLDRKRQAFRQQVRQSRGGRESSWRRASIRKGVVGCDVTPELAWMVAPEWRGMRLGRLLFLFVCWVCRWGQCRSKSRTAMRH